MANDHCSRNARVSAYLVLMAVLAGQPTARAGHMEQPRGVFVLMSAGQQAVAQELLALPVVAGISLREPWSALEPQPGQYDWSSFDAPIAQARHAGKQVMLRVYAGIGAPDWALEGVTTATGQARVPGVRSARAVTFPVPWDPVYLKRWHQFVAALGARYGADPTVVLVHMTGPTFKSGEMHLPKGPGMQATWERAGYTSDRLVNAWTDTIASYARAFPDTCLALNLAHPIVADDVLRRLVAVGVERYPDQLCFQHNGLHENSGSQYEPHALIAALDAERCAGFQMVGPTTDREHARSPRRSRRDRKDAMTPYERGVGDLPQAISIGRAAGAQYFEIYRADLRNPALAAAWGEVDASLAADRRSLAIP